MWNEIEPTWYWTHKMRFNSCEMRFNPHVMFNPHEIRFNPCKMRLNPREMRLNPREIRFGTPIEFQNPSFLMFNLISRGLNLIFLGKFLKNFDEKTRLQTLWVNKNKASMWLWAELWSWVSWDLRTTGHIMSYSRIRAPILYLVTVRTLRDTGHLVFLVHLWCCTCINFDYNSNN